MAENQHDKLFNIIESNIRQHARYQKITLSELASAIGMTEAGFYKMLSSESIKVKTLKKLSEVLHQPIESFFEEFILPTKGIRSYTKKHLSNYHIAAEPQAAYGNDREILLKQIKLLESQIEDKNKIIELLSKG
ncbi:helix-turn-helix domain-containing protein [Mucilaginibacter sp. KACC 22063]|uniref:helix-turn-helix domain-containing protein n=1 Tax=Mucilaginibacter sp. KACC 22063 TaxID=3025666 RepID=UPI002366690D|nr:helix-turn-helix domain-containing protein [Mucilaginibacter sp. KACC 22063]WDF57081.1 helix-turn-helix domain-containing protein [Mucilaginibacter sp. KACC 22063]